MSNHTVVVGDCREVMRGMAAESVDAIVTDPPYDLTARKKGGSGAASVNLDSPYGRARIGTGNGGGFMGKAWDSTGIAFDPATWIEALRVLKPGGHLLAFGGTRTYHRLTCAIEDAGFEIRDCVAWMYGSGFPKSLDVSKAIDKRRVDDVRPVCRFLRAAMDRAGLDSRALAERFGFHSRMVDHWAARDTDSQPSVPTWEQWLALKELLGFGDDVDAEVWRLNERKGTPGEAWFERPEVDLARPGMAQSWTDGKGWNGNAARGGDAVTALASRWQGFGTALKPAFEPIVVARKPLVGTVAANVERYGCGALNIDGCRIGTTKDVPASPSRTNGNALSGSVDGSLRRETGNEDGHNPNVGRWPANVVLDESAAEMLDAQTGERKSGKMKPTRIDGDAERNVYGKHAAAGFTTMETYGDSGGASRFFYVAKASRAERNAGLDGMPERTTDDGRSTPIDNPFLRGETERRNHHPTVKPIALMRWLVRLVAPPGGLVFDPFLGSGSTGCAAALEGCDFLGCDLDPEYVEIARRRIAHHAALAEESRDEPWQASLLDEVT